MTTITVALAALAVTGMLAQVWHTQHRADDTDRANRAMAARLHARRTAEQEHRTNKETDEGL